MSEFMSNHPRLQNAFEQAAGYGIISVAAGVAYVAAMGSIGVCTDQHINPVATFAVAAAACLSPIAVGAAVAAKTCKAISKG